MIERLKFNPDAWYCYLEAIASLPPREKYRQLVRLHKNTLNWYIKALNTMTEDQAEKPGSDGRLRKIVVAHIMGWEEWQIQVFEDPDRNERLKQQLRMKGYKDPVAGELSDFNSVDEFNARQEEIYAGYPWEEIKHKAVTTAKRLRSIFPENPSDEWLSFLNNSPEKVWHLTKNITIVTPSAWYLWMVSLEHEAVEHREDLISGFQNK